MMLPADMALIWDKDFRKYVERYAADGEAFANDFKAAFEVHARQTTLCFACTN